jgi:hypothetical protein
MKIKKIERKLSLNKKTVANLNGSMMGNVYGADLPPNEHNTEFPSCYMPPTECPDCTLVTCQTCNTCETQACATCDTCRRCDTWACPTALIC